MTTINTTKKYYSFTLSQEYECDRLLYCTRVSDTKGALGAGVIKSLYKQPSHFDSKP